MIPLLAGREATLARTLVARRDNLEDTIAALEKRLVSFASGPEGIAFEYDVICA
jgi:hypothetical protein